MQETTGKVAIITGAGSGIGRAVALAFAAEGMKIVCSGRRRAQLDETAALIADTTGEAAVVPTDVTDQVQVDHLVAHTLARFGRIDVLINNAGSFGAVGPLWEVDPVVWWRDIEINLRGSMLCTRGVLPHMLAHDGGVIVNLSGGGAAQPMAGGSGYGTSKAALLRFTDTLARELETIGSRVLVFAIDPGFNPTEMTRALVRAPAAARWLPFIQQRLQSGEGRRPEECAATLLALVRLAPPLLNGCVLHAGDDIALLTAHGEQIRAEARLVLRFRALTAPPA